MANQIIKGRDLMLFDNDGHSYAYATNHTLTITAETTDISSKDHGIWGGAEVSKYTWELNSENLYTTEDYDRLFDLMIAAEPITVRFGVKSTPVDTTLTPAMGNMALPYWTSANAYYQGKVVITSLVANAPNGDTATYQVTLTGSGFLRKTTPSEQGTQGAQGGTQGTQG